MSETHKLAVILFADIAGYTAMMEHNEVEAMVSLNRFKEIIETEVPSHNGEIIQFFGDGALLSFDSSSRALACATLMQKTFLASPKVPVRMGIHLGEVLFKDGNAFGNGVNIASRIESLGVPGAILVSKTIRNQIKNKEIYQLRTLGSFAFKNVTEPMEVYALANPGLIVPLRSEMQGKLKNLTKKRLPLKPIGVILALLIIAGFIWPQLSGYSKPKNLLPEDVRQEKVAVAVFNNFTNDSNLDALGNMASDWISSGLRELDVKTASPEMMRRYQDKVGILPNNPEKKVSLYDLTEAQYVLTGSYYQKGDSLQIVSRLESTITGDNIYEFPTILGLTQEKEQLVVEISEQLKGFWALKKENKLATLTPPKYEAYQAFLECWIFDPICLQSVLDIDPNFLLARIYLAYAAISLENDSLYQASRTYIKEHWEKCSEFEQNFFTFCENRYTGNRKASQLAMEKNLQLDPQNLTVVHYVAYGHLLLNQPELTVETLAPFFDRYEIFKDQILGNSYHAYFFALNRIGEHQKPVSFAKKEIPEWSLPREVVRALMLEGEWSTIQAQLDSFSPQLCLRFTHMFNDIFPSDSTNIFAPLVREQLDFYQDPKPSYNYFVWSNYHLYNWDSKAFAYYQLKEWKEAEKILLGLRNIDWKDHVQGSIPRSLITDINWQMDTWREGLLGATYARLGKEEMALAQIKQLETFRASSPGIIMRMHRGIIPYWKARIYAILGEKEKAVASLEQSMKEGRRIEFQNFVFDWDLSNLKGFEPYEELVRPQK